VTFDRPSATNPGASGWSAPSHDEAPLAFHRSMPGYAPTPLVELPAALAERLGVARIWVKDESDRFGLPAFKVLGASWAANRAISARSGRGPAATFEELIGRAAESPLTLVSATDGNHGRALAHIARRLGLSSRVYVAAGLPDTTVQAIRDEGADVIDAGRVYDDTVRIAAASTEGNPDDLLVQDTAWEGYEDVPRWIVAGYSTLFAEIDEQHPDAPGLVVVPTGVGSLLQAALEHYRAAGRAQRPDVLAVEPATAACVTASLAAGTPVSVDADAPTIMAGLNCGTVSSLAWPTVRAALTAGVGVTDDEAAAALTTLEEAGLHVGPCGAAALAGLAAAPLALERSTDVVLVSTEGIAANPLPRGTQRAR
jgi:diaminopropionate ammonia-lyase